MDHREQRSLIGDSSRKEPFGPLRIGQDHISDYVVAFVFRMFSRSVRGVRGPPSAPGPLIVTFSICKDRRHCCAQFGRVYAGWLGHLGARTFLGAQQLMRLAREFTHDPPIAISFRATTFRRDWLQVHVKIPRCDAQRLVVLTAVGAHVHEGSSRKQQKRFQRRELPVLSPNRAHVA